MSDPWFKFYPTDWRSDPRLRMCGLAARGLWIEMIAVMHEATPYGHLLVAGQSPTDAQLAVLAGTPPDQIPGLVGELESSGVFSRTGAGVIFSRKMTRSAKKSAVAKKNGKNGGNPSLRKQKEISASDNQNTTDRVKPQKPEARDQIEKEKPTVSPKSRGTRWPAGQPVPSEWITTASGQYPSVQRQRIEAEARKFADHWPSQPRGIKLDWAATWRNWLRTAFPGLEGGSAPTAGGPEPGYVSLPPEHPDFRAVERLRGKPVIVGNRGKATFIDAEIEQARRYVADHPAGLLEVHR